MGNRVISLRSIIFLKDHLAPLVCHPASTFPANKVAQQQGNHHKRMDAPGTAPVKRSYVKVPTCDGCGYRCEYHFVCYKGSYYCTERCRSRASRREPIFDTTECSWCGRSGAGNQCSKCKSAYCNKWCQQQDWNGGRHRYICWAKPTSPS